MPSGSMFSQAQQPGQQVLQEQQEAMTGPKAEEHVTEGYIGKYKQSPLGERPLRAGFQLTRSAPARSCSWRKKSLDRPKPPVGCWEE